MTSGSDIIDGLKQAVRGDLSRVTFYEGEQRYVWTRHDVGSPEDLISRARDTIADQQTEIDMLKQELEALIQSHTARSGPSEKVTRPDAPRLEKRSAYWTYDDKAAKEHGYHLYYFAPSNRAPPPYATQRHVEAIIDIAGDGTLAGVELIFDMPPPPRNSEARVNFSDGPESDPVRLNQPFTQTCPSCSQSWLYSPRCYACGRGSG